MNEEKQTVVVPNGKQCPQCGVALPTGALAGLCPACLLKQGTTADTATQPAVPTFEPPSIAEVARLFPQLEILALLGKGGMGAVYKARQPALDRQVALKILPPQTAVGTSFAERFNREARALARLSHPNIVAVHEFGQVSSSGAGVPLANVSVTVPVAEFNSPATPPTTGTVVGTTANGTLAPLAAKPDALHYFIMEFVDGANLRQLEQAGRLSPREALQIIPQICDALQYAHDEGVVHRDVKPENVLVDRKGRVKIADFGLAKILGREPGDLRLTGEGQVMGTPHYMAPEQVEHPLEVDHRADIYALGVVFYEMLTGELPLGKFPPPSRKVQIDVRLDDVVLHALEKEPALRYQQASEVKTDVETIASAAEVQRQTPQLSRSAMGAELERGRWLIMAAGFIMCLAGAVMGFNLPPQFGIPMVIWGIVGFILATAKAVRSAGSLERDLATIRAARKIILVDGIGICLGALLVVLNSSGLSRPYAIFLAVVCALGIVVCVLRLLGVEPLPASLVPRTGVGREARTPSGSSPPAKKPVSLAVRVGLVVGFVALLMMAVVTLLLPESYVSTARLAVASTNEPPWIDSRFFSTELEVLRSQPVLDRVIEQLNLEDRWGKRYAAGAKLARHESVARLKRQLDMRQTRSTSLIEIRVFSDDRHEAAYIANAIAETYRALRTNRRVEIVDRAEPGLRPVRPNKPLNLALGVALGLVLGLLTGGLTLLLARAGRSVAPTTGQAKGDTAEVKPQVVTVQLPTHPWGVRIGLACVVLTGVVLLGIALQAWLSGPKQPNVSVTGIVTDALTGKPIAGARVADNRYGSGAHKAPQEAWTDAAGNYCLRTWYEEHTLAASAPGYETTLGTLLTKLLSREGEVRLDFQLRPATSNQALAFSPVIDRVLVGLRVPGASSDCTASFLDLDTGEFRVPPTNVLAQLIQVGEEVAVGNHKEPAGDLPGWLKQSGADLLGWDFYHGTTLLFFECPPGSVQDNHLTFEAVKPEAIVNWHRSFPPKPSAPAWFRETLPVYRVPLHNEPYRKANFIYFLTREGGLGVLQITGQTDNPRGLKIRYKLVLPAASGSTTSAPVHRLPTISQPDFIQAEAVLATLSVLGDDLEKALERRDQASAAKLMEPFLQQLESLDRLVRGTKVALPTNRIPLVRQSRDAIKTGDLTLAETLFNTAVAESGSDSDFAGEITALAEQQRAAGNIRLEVRTNAAANSASTAAELWSPSLKPGEKPDPDKVREEANQLAAQGRYEEALQRHIWYHNHALEYGVGQGGVRLSFALAAWTELARKYPKARQALVEIRDRKTRDLAEGRGSFDLFHDVASINSYLQDDDATYALFKTLREKDPALARQCYFVVEDLLVKKGEYELCLSFIQDFHARFDAIRKARELDRKLEREDRPEFRRESENRFVGKARQLIEILVATGHKAEAEKVREQAMAVSDDARLKSAVSDVEKIVGK